MSGVFLKLCTVLSWHIAVTVVSGQTGCPTPVFQKLEEVSSPCESLSIGTIFGTQFSATYQVKTTGAGMQTVLNLRESMNLKIERYAWAHVSTDAAGWTNGGGSTLVNDGQWHDIGVSYDGANVKFYVDGVLDGQLSKSGNIFSSGAIYYGCRLGSQEHFSGDLANLRVYNQVLTDDQFSTCPESCTDNCVSTPGWTIDSNPVTTCGWMEHICGPMRRGECLEHGGNVKCQWGYVTSNHWANYGPYGSPVSHCCNCKGFQMPENFADSYWTTAPASWVWNGNWKNTYSSTGTELPICDPTPSPTLEPTVAPTGRPTAEPTMEPTLCPSANPTGEPTEEAYVKVPGDSSCAAEGYEDYTDAMGGTAQGCRKAAESVGYDFSSPASQLHAIPVQHNANGEHRSCVACENMIYQGRPTLLFFDSQSRSVNPNQCEQSGEQIKFHICKRKSSGDTSLTSDTAISLKQGSQYVSCVGGTHCKLEPNFSDSAKLMFRKGYNKANGNENGDHSDSSVIEVGDPFVIILTATANTFYPTLDCSTSTCSYQNHMNTGQGHWGSPNKINIAGGSTSGAVSIGDEIRFTQMSGGWNAWNADWGISCDATKCGGAAGGGAIFTVCDSNGDCGTPVPVNCVMNQWENSGGCSATCGGGSQLQTRTVQTPAANGGTACPSTSQTIRCNTDACPLETASTFNDPVVSNGFYCGNGAGQLVPGYRFLRTVNMDADQCKVECGNDKACKVFTIPTANIDYECRGSPSGKGPCCMLMYVNDGPRDAPSNQICPNSSGGYARAPNSYRLWAKKAHHWQCQGTFAYRHPTAGLHAICYNDPHWARARAGPCSTWCTWDVSVGYGCGDNSLRMCQGSSQGRRRLTGRLLTERSSL